MKKIAFFVEGLTEQLFIEKILTEILGEKSLQIDKRKMTGGGKNPISIIEIASPTINENADYYFLIYDCSGETNVSTFIRDQREKLLKNDYSFIFGLLDVYPKFKREEIERLKRGLYYNLPQAGLQTKFILAVMEIEAWFIADNEHYAKIDTSLSNKLIVDNFNFDPEKDNTEIIDAPADFLHKIYQLAGKAYSKDRRKLSRTINCIDSANIYFNVKDRIPSLNEFIFSVLKEF